MFLLGFSGKMGKPHPHTCSRESVTVLPTQPVFLILKMHLKLTFFLREGKKKERKPKTTEEMKSKWQMTKLYSNMSVTVLNVNVPNYSNKIQRSPD